MLKEKIGRYALRLVRRLYPDAEYATVKQVRYPHKPDWTEATGGSVELYAARGATMVQLEVVFKAIDPAYPDLREKRYPDWHVYDLIQPSKTGDPNIVLAHKNFEVLKLALSIEYHKARESARSYDWKFIRPRQRDMIACDAHGARCRFADEAVAWDGTLASLIDFAKHGAQHGATEIYVEGGFDGSDWFDFDDYTPTDEFYGVTAVKITQPNERSPQ